MIRGLHDLAVFVAGAACGGAAVMLFALAAMLND